MDHRDSDAAQCAIITSLEGGAGLVRILIDLSSAVQGHGGLGRYAEELTRALVALGSGDDLQIFYNDPLRRLPSPPLDVLPRKVLGWSNKPWRLTALFSKYTHVSLDRLLGEADVFHATDHLLPRLSRTRSVFTLHDLAFLRVPEAHLPLNRWFLKLMMPFFLRQADQIIAVSEFSKRDALAYYGLDESKFLVIPEGVSPGFRPVQDPVRLAEVRYRYGLPDRFILFVSTIEPRKNLNTLWEAYRTLRAEGRTEGLVVVGKKGWLYEDTMLRLREAGLEQEVTFPGYVAEADLPAVYGLADCFAFPSLFEGFGLTPLEAMASGCPVVCSNSSSLPEVCGDAAILVAPKDVQGLASSLRRVLNEPDLRAELRNKGIRQAARFTWESTAKRTLEVYKRAMSC